MKSFEVISPKQDAKNRTVWDEFFPYYAGYPVKFASTIIESIDLARGSVVLDPWSGSGTTPYAAARAGVDSLGFDINPAMVVVAKARLLPPSEASSLLPIVDQIIGVSRSFEPLDAHDPLSVWFGPQTACHLRSVEMGIREVLVGRQLNAETDINSISCLASAFYVALFAVTRSLAGKFRGSNPTWLRSPKKGEIRVSVSQERIFMAFRSKLAQMADALASQRDIVNDSRIDIRLADSTNIPLPDSTVDAVITSPPYCTRIDYATTTRSELAVLHGLLPSCHVDLGRRMLGSIRVPQRTIEVRESWGGACGKFLRAVASHESKASAGYYLKTHLDYFDKLDKSIGEVSRVLKSHGVLVMVVQDSFYKDIHNDLPRIVTEISRNHSLRIRQRNDFLIRRSMASINNKSKAYRSRSDAVEAVLCFQKD
ncbi:DNA methylase N-4/N-6 domain protein [Pseudoxanthomonas suwonensis 11-1]|uniref:Methyltransferase n=1 Tax=Pseudoxanthomonas suwonensis (strain 11-1) TaxID=743721 RepID=E6WTH0_PSEUU|nr:DNA methyltransferase [Pseudoxanthomonas suwonensis]ADV27469.1 DNA methylase N-4/N-6 domain protein [Pseudoxanthomonas suwonensis 11-1]